MGAFTNIDHKETHFEKAELTPIRGEPTYETLEHLLKELKANVRNVHSNLGGGAHGHLGLVISHEAGATKNLPSVGFHACGITRHNTL